MALVHAPPCLDRLDGPSHLTVTLQGLDRVGCWAAEQLGQSTKPNESRPKNRFALHFCRVHGNWRSPSWADQGAEDDNAELMSMCEEDEPPICACAVSSRETILIETT